MENVLLTTQKRMFGFYVGLSSLLIYLGIDQEAMAIYSIFLVIDTITGFVKAWRVGNNPTSAKFYNGIISKIGLLAIPLIVAALFRGLGREEVSGITTSTVLSLFLLAEAYSIIQNIYSIRIGKEILEYDATRAVTNIVLNTIRGAIKDNK